MKHYSYIARTSVGIKKTGTIDAENEGDVQKKLDGQGLTVTLVTEVSESAKKGSDIIERLFGGFRKVSLTERTVFTQNLYVMTKSGIPLAQSLGVLGEQTKNKYFRSILLNMKTSLEHGDPFAKALAQYPKCFSEVYVNMVAAGEASGKLENIFQQLAKQLKKDRALMGKIRSALTYPIIVVVAMIGLGIAMMVFVIPKITDIYKEMEANLPLPTKVLIGTSAFILQNGILSIIIVVALLVGFRFFSRSNGGKRFLHRIYLRVPIGGVIIKKVNLARFSRTLHALLKTDIPIVQSFQIIEHILGNVHYKIAVRTAGESLRKGVTIVETLKKDPSLFPPMVTQMISIGEESGRLDELADEIANFYEEDIDETMASFSSIIEPVLMLVLGVGVGLMAVAILLPMYSLTENI